MYKNNLIAENKITISDSFYGKSKNKIAVAFFSKFPWLPSQYSQMLQFTRKH